MEPRTRLNSLKGGCAPKNRPMKDDSTSRCTGYLPMPAFLDQIEIWFSLLQRKCLQPNHFVTAAALETALTEYIAYYNQTAKPINWTYTVQKLEQKLGAHL